MDIKYRRMLNVWTILFLFPCWMANEHLQLVWMVPKTFPEYNISSSVGTLAMAFKRIQTEQLLPGYQFNITWLDTACDSQRSIGLLSDHMMTHSRIDVILGPPCTEAMVPVADLAAYYNIPVFSWVTRQYDVDNKTQFSTLVRSRPPISSLVEMFYAISYKHKWKRAAILYTDGLRSTRILAESMITKFSKDKQFNLAKQFAMSLNASTEEINPVMESIKMTARIIFIIIHHSELRQYMLAFHDHGMTGGDYQFLFTEMDVTSVASLTKKFIWMKNDGRDEAARQAFESLLYFTFIYILDDNPKLNAAYDDFEEIFGNSSMPQPTKPDEHSTFLYDAVILFAIALNETTAANKNTTGTEIVNACAFKYFTGLSGKVFINDVGDRYPGFIVWDMAPSGKFRMALTLNYTPDLTNSGVNASRMVQKYNAIIWGDGRTSTDYIPPDRPDCGFYNELCLVDTTRTVLIVTLISTTMLLMFMGGLWFLRWWRREREVNQMTWRIPYAELDFNFRQHKNKSKSNFTLGANLSGSHETLASDSSTHGGSGFILPRPASNIGSVGSVVVGGAMHKHLNLARYRNSIVVVKPIRKSRITIDRVLLLHMNTLFSIKHANLATFIGMCTEPDKISVVWGFCAKGSLRDVVDNCDMKMDGAFQFSIAIDICMGLVYLHAGPMKIHGNLRSTNCIIDNHWVCKLTDFGLRPVRHGESRRMDMKEDEEFSDLFWMAPELLRGYLLTGSYSPSQYGDIYALSIVLKELLCLSRPYSNELSLTPKEIIQAVAHPVDKLMRPVIQDIHDEYYSIRVSFKKVIHGCWAEDPGLRPTAKKVQKTIKRLSPYRSSTVLDNMVTMMERYSNRLEEVVNERTAQLEDEKRKTDQLLYKMLPRTVADALKLGNHVKAEYYDAVTVYFSDIVGFTTMAADSSPLEIVEFLNSLYSVFDDIIQKFDVYKVETIGDAYMVVSGLPIRNGEKHVTEMADMALTLLQSVLEFKIPHRPERQLKIRAGLHSGSVVAGVVGLTMPRYCLFGDTVNTASRMESNGRPLLIHISPETESLLKHHSEYKIQERGNVFIKGKGMMETYWLLGKEGLFVISDKIVENSISVVCDVDIPAKSPTSVNPDENDVSVLTTEQDDQEENNQEGSEENQISEQDPDNTNSTEHDDQQMKQNPDNTNSTEHDDQQMKQNPDNTNSTEHDDQQMNDAQIGIEQQREGDENNGMEEKMF